MLPCYATFLGFPGRCLASTVQSRRCSTNSTKLSWIYWMFFYPLKSVSVNNRDLYFVTPYIKVLLRQRNKLMHRNKVEATNSITEKIRKSIVTSNSTTFAHSDMNSNKLWEKVRTVTGSNRKIEWNVTTLTADSMLISRQTNNMWSQLKNQYKTNIQSLSTNVKYSKFWTLSRLPPPAWMEYHIGSCVSLPHSCANR